MKKGDDGTCDYIRRIFSTYGKTRDYSGSHISSKSEKKKITPKYSDVVNAGLDTVVWLV